MKRKPPRLSISARIGSTALRECGLEVGALAGFGGEQVQHEVEAQVVGAADLVQERLVGADDGVSRCRPYSPIEATSEQSGRVNSTGML